jgi:hypothetical protein
MTSLGHPERFQSERALNLVRHLLGWSTPMHAGRIRAGTTPLGDLAAGEFVLFVSYLSCRLALPISPFFLLLLEELGLQLQHLTPHSILQAAIFVHLCEMFVGVAPCTSLFRHFFVLVKSGKAKDHLGAYYFQTRSDSVVAYIPTLGGARWENWLGDWVIASAEANDLLVLLSDGPALDRKQWRAKPSLAPEFLLVLDRIKTLATGGLTSMHVVGDFLKRRTAPLQRRARMCCWFTGPNDIDRIQRGPGTDLSWEELELLVKGITGESFVPNPPPGHPCALRRPKVEDGDLGHAADLRRERRGGSPDWRPGPPPRDPDLRCIGWRPPVCRRGSQRPGRGPPPLGQGQKGCRQFLRPMGHLFQTPQKCQRTAGGVEEAGSQAQGVQRRVSPPPPPPSGPPPPQPPPPSVPSPPPPPGGDLPQGHQQQQQQQQQRQQQLQSPRFQGRWKVQGPK